MTEIRLTRPLRLLAPAKINLGLEITGCRADGYHEIVTILQAVDFFDELVLTPADTFSYDGDPRIPENDDLVLRAFGLAETRLGVSLHARVQLKKSIPLAAGLGGGSSDAGTMLAALGALAHIADDELLGIATELGSDVPFFIRGGTSLATGTGTDLEALSPCTQTWFVIVTPDAHIPRKTARLYASLRPDDFSDGQATREIGEQLRQLNTFDPRLLHNTFARPLYKHPLILQARESMRHAGASTVIPSGAGPSLFGLFESRGAANDVADRLHQRGITSVVCTAIPLGINDEQLRQARQ
jgi:4-diphosphocytidyl-2-C-methyl-D-erythritol kinase